ISTCVGGIARAPVRATYVNMYKWPESDVEFIKTVISRINHNSNIECSQPKPMVLDNLSYRQLYLRSYTFSREESVIEKKILKFYKELKRKARNVNGFRRAKKTSCVALASIFRSLLSCTINVNVID
ncbi:hypothetical protein A4A49_63404, partial [Nicotiana attenuata]